ncbi:MAG: DUF4199 domain-containing protein [Amphiplicatus sp.]
MLRYAAIYGGIAGAIVIGVMIAGFMMSGDEGMHGSVWAGYLTMLVALSMIFIAIKRFRDKEKGGVIKFWPAFGLGLATAAAAGVIYVAVWEVYLAANDYDFIDSYTQSVLEKKKEEGLSGEALEKEAANMKALADSYDNPLFRVPMTFLEIFPVGLVVALISAAILRNPKAFPARA